MKSLARAFWWVGGWLWRLGGGKVVTEESLRRPSLDVPSEPCVIVPRAQRVFISAEVAISPDLLRDEIEALDRRREKLCERLGIAIDEETADPNYDDRELAAVYSRHLQIEETN